MYQIDINTERSRYNFLLFYLYLVMPACCIYVVLEIMINRIESLYGE